MEEHNSSDIDFGKISPYQPRQFVPCDVDLNDVGQVAAMYNKLYERDITSTEQLESFLLDRSELDSVLGQHKAILYIRMTCQTDDPVRANGYKKYIETILPAPENSPSWHRKRFDIPGSIVLLRFAEVRFLRGTIQRLLSYCGRKLHSVFYPKENSCGH